MYCTLVLDVLDDAVYSARVLLISEMPILLLRDVNDCRGQVNQVCVRLEFRTYHPRLPKHGLVQPFAP